LHILLEPHGSQLTETLVSRLRERHPKAVVHYHAPLSTRRTWEGARLAFGRVVETHVDFRRADVLLAIDSDFLVSGPASLRYARHVAERRRVTTASDTMSRIYVAEPAPSVTGSSCDHRLRLRRVDTLAFTCALFAELAIALPERAPSLLVRAVAPLRRPAPYDGWVRAFAADALRRPGRSVIVIGEAAPPIAHALVHAMNDMLGSVGDLIRYAPSPIVDAGAESHSLGALAAAIDAGDVETLAVLGGNPVYTAPADLDLAAKLRGVKRSVYLGLYENETADACVSYAPLAHPLESWGDARGYDGTRTIVQPLTAAGASAKTVDEFLAAWNDDFARPPNSHDLTREHWNADPKLDGDAGWRRSLREGVVAASAFASVSPSLDWAALSREIANAAPPPTSHDVIELVLREDGRVRDGAGANNAWLMELPDPVTKLTWDNAALLSRTTAKRLGLTSGDVVHLRRAGLALQAPVLVTTGQADDSVSLSFGYGRRGAETIADGIGASAFALQTVADMWGGAGLVVEKTARTHPLALAQSHFALEGRDDEILLRATLDEFRSNVDFAREANAPKRSLYVVPPASPRQWGMVIDLSACTGCSACVVACQAENNIAVVGKAGVMKGREMHWIRIDRYFTDESDDAMPSSEPMLCQHCEHAPCEYVCPVNATTHSDDGLNQMVYNRCVGTRFCSNNCPWKVRRFNWFDYQLDPLAAPPRAQNPDVTVRSRGVMEKCTYCVQRIREAEIHAKVAHEPLTDGTVKTACQQACPSAAIAFGDIGDPKSAVSTERANPRLFAVLNELGTVPHTRYLAKITNPNGEVT
jgi:molybdopterin-containing oxidoreductase family iron-sulfur binding subunit